MKFPDQPQDGKPVADTIKQIITYLRASRVSGINGVPGRESPNGTSFVVSIPESTQAGKGIAPGALVVTTTRPSFIAAPTTEPAANTVRVWVTYGTINSKVATNLTSFFDITTARTIYAKATFTTTGAFAVTSWVIESQAADWVMPTPSGPRPSTGYYQLGAVFVVGDSLSVASNGDGSLTVWPQISNSLTGTNADSVIVWRR